MANGGDYELAWPRDLVRDELSVLVNSESQKDWAVKVDLLLRDAFSTSVPAQEFASVPDDGFGKLVNAPTGQRKFLASILRRLDQFPDAFLRRPYWSERRAGASAGRQALTLEAVARYFVNIVNALDGRGYFEEAFEKDCVDDPSTTSPSFVIYERTGRESMWPLDPLKLAEDRDVFLDVVEVLHDLIARPRNGSIHNYSQCGWHYSEFSRETGRRLYRWQVNRLLDRSDLGLRLASEGEDEGRLVKATDDARTDLLQRMAERPDDLAGRIGHAVALFRRRDATEHDKRSAVMVLGLVLEERRALLKGVLYSGDEGALFEIANKFAIRHQDQRQKSDYDPVFLDWVFWWYLATIELTDGVIARSGPS
ncbi:hypothetical protein [Mycobacterium sp. AT1]|uniref:hypothetical protein n=1 Tax=Mycobacterium sp. AT1 TaxID=1961706 RepID=UPI0009C70493|nr:hypothetical protein [Mycobacterium sp. AT1]OPX05532.1 hypothetical protein B1790_31620 [Mycobacterium sp. AT1]